MPKVGLFLPIDLILFFFVVLQVWAFLDLHHLDICGSFHRYICYLHSTQSASKRMGLWYQSHDLVCWFVLWLCLYSASCLVSNPQILLCSIGLRPSTLSLWLLAVCLHSCYGKTKVASFSPRGSIFFSHILSFENVSSIGIYIC